MIFCADWNLIHDDNSSHASQSTQQQQRPHLSLAAAVDAANTKSRNCKAPPCLWQLPLTVNIQVSIGRLEGRQERLCNVIKLTERESELCKRLICLEKWELPQKRPTNRSQYSVHQVWSNLIYLIFLLPSLIKSDLIRRMKHLVVAGSSSSLSTSGPIKALLR